MFKHAMALLLSLVLVMGALVAAPRPVRAALNEADYQDAASQLNRYGLVQGDEQGYRFYAQITRAEMAKLLVYSLGQQSQAPRYVGRGTFKDTNGHWAEGVVALAKLNGIMKGYPDGTFQPQGAVTYAETITVLARLTGVPGSSLPWPRTYLGPAQEAGIVPDGMELYSRLDQPAARGDVFVLLWRALTEVKNQKGENLLRTYLDHGAPVLTVDPQPTETSDPTLTVSGTAQGAAKVIINGTPAALSYTYFQATVNLRVGPNTIRIQALDDAGNVKEHVVQITRKQSPISAVNLTGPARVGAGEDATFTISLKDQNGQDVPDHKGVLASVLPAGLGEFDAETGVFTAGTKPGLGTITIKSGGGQASVNVAVVPGPVDHLTIDPPVAALTARQSTLFTVKGADKYGNEVSVSQVQWTAGGGTITQMGVYTAPDSTGLYTVTASVDGKTATAQVQPPNYKAKTVRLSQPTGTLKANGASQLTLTATVLDDSGNVMTDYMGSLTITSSQPDVAAPSPQTVAVSKGVAQITVKAGRTSGKATITASTNLDGQGSVDVTVAPQHLQSVRLDGYSVPGSVSAFPTGYVEAVALDEDGYPMYSSLGQTLVVRVRLPGGSGTGALVAWFTQNDAAEANVALGAVDATTGDVRTRTYINYMPGAGTMLIEGKALSTMSWVQVQSGALTADQVGMPARLAIEAIPDTPAGADQYVYAVILDSAGNRISRGSMVQGYSVQLRDQNGVTYTGTTNDTDIGTGRVRFTVNQTVVGTYTYTATLQPGGAAESRQAQVVPGAAADFKLTVTPESLKADNASRATIRVEMTDVFQNRVTGRVYPVTFHLNQPSTGALQPFDDKTVNTSGGIAEFKVTAATVVAVDQVRVTIPNPDGGNWEKTATVTTAGGEDHLVLSYGDNDGNTIPGEPQDSTGRVGQTMIVYADALDRFGNPATFSPGRSVTLTVRNMQDGTQSSLAPTSVSGGRATFAVSRTAAATYALKAESSGLTPSVTAGFGGNIADLTIQAAQSTRVTVAPDLSLLRIGAQSWASIKAQLVDAAGNPTSNASGRTITVTLEIPRETNGGTALGTFRVGNLPAGAATLKQSVEIQAGASTSDEARFFAGTSAGSKTVTWTAQDGTTGSFSITTAASATIAKLGITAPSVDLVPWNSGAPGDGQIVTVTVQDSNGVQMSDADGWVTLNLLDSDTRITGVWDANYGYWRVPSSSGGMVTSLTWQAYRGQALFRVRANTSGMKTYAISYAKQQGGTAAISAQGNGLFLAPGADSLQVRVSGPQYVAGNGGRTVISAVVLDKFGNVIDGVGGTVTFSLADPTTGTLSSPQTVSLNGPLGAYVVFTAGAFPAGQITQVRINAVSTLLKATDNTPLTGSATVNVDTLTPQATSITLMSGQGTPDGVVNQGDEIQITFSEPMHIYGGWNLLNPDQSETTGLGTIEFVGGQDSVIKFGGNSSVPNTIQLPGMALAQGTDATYAISRATLSLDGTLLTIELGAPVSGTANPSITVPGGSTATATWQPAIVKDRAENPAASTGNIPISGGF